MSDDRRGPRTMREARLLLEAAVRFLPRCMACGEPHVPHFVESSPHLAPQWGADDGHAYRVPKR